MRRILKFGLSPEATFLREVLLDEIAKGLDALSRSQLEDSYDALRASLPSPWNVVLPPPAPSDLTEDDLEHLDNLRRLAALFAWLQPQEEGQGGTSVTSSTSNGGGNGNSVGGGSSGGSSGAPLSLVDIQKAVEQIQGTLRGVSVLGVVAEVRRMGSHPTLMRSLSSHDVFLRSLDCRPLLAVAHPSTANSIAVAI